MYVPQLNRELRVSTRTWRLCVERKNAQRRVPPVISPGRPHRNLLNTDNGHAYCCPSVCLSVKFCGGFSSLSSPFCKFFLGFGECIAPFTITVISEHLAQMRKLYGTNWTASISLSENHCSGFLKIAVPDFCEILHKHLFLLEHVCDKDDIAEERQPCYT